MNAEERRTEKLGQEKHKGKQMNKSGKTQFIRNEVEKSD